MDEVHRGRCVRNKGHNSDTRETCETVQGGKPALEKGQRNVEAIRQLWKQEVVRRVRRGRRLEKAWVCGRRCHRLSQQGQLPPSCEQEQDGRRTKLGPKERRQVACFPRSVFIWLT